MKPFISVIMPVYNNEAYVEDTIKSILKQTYTNFEFIIVDDCSTDNSWNIIQEYAKKDKRIKAYQNKKNLKIAKTRNKGFAKASKKAKYYAITDSDDISTKTRFAKQVSFLEKNHEYALVGSDTTIINEKNKVIGIRKYPHSWNKIRKTFTSYNPIAQPVAMIRADMLRKNIGFYNEKYTRCQDYDMWFRIAEKHKIANISKPLLKYRISQTQGKTTHLKKTIRFTLDIQRRWLFHKRFFTIKGIIGWAGVFIISRMPDKALLYIFKKIFYK